MMSAKNTGRLIGAMILAQVIGGMSVNLFLTAPLFGSPGFLATGATNAQQIGVSVLIGLASSGLSLAVAIAGYRLFRAGSPALSIALIAVSAVALSVTAVEYINMMSMVSFSEAWAQAGATHQEVLEAAKVIVASARNWAHYIGLILSGCTLFLLYLVLFHSRLVPRWLAVFGMVAVMLQLVSVSLPLLGHNVIFQLLAPLGLCQILLSIWLLAVGFNSDRYPDA
jgi:hypothetical protein